VFPPEERAKAIAIWAGVTGAAGAIGPVASGWLLGHFWYGSIFLVNVPIVVIALVAGFFLVPKSKDPEEGRLDPIGAGLSIIGIASLVYGLIQAPEQGWSSPATIGSFIASVFVLTLFVGWERRRLEPMLDMSYFRNPAFSTATSGMILAFMSMFGVMFLITQYFQLVLGYSPLSAALRLLPMAPIMMIVSPLTPRIIARIGANRTVAAGMWSIALGFLAFQLLGLHTPYLYVLFCMIWLVGGIALTMSPMTASIMSAVPPRRAGAGSAMNDATRELGAALGVAVLGSIAASRFSSGIKPAIAPLSPTDQASARASLGTALQTAARLPHQAATRLVTTADKAFVSGVHLAAAAGTVLAACSGVLVLRFLPRQIAQHGAVRGPLEAAEDAAELGLAGIPPVFADTAYADTAADMEPVLDLAATPDEAAG